MAKASEEYASSLERDLTQLKNDVGTTKSLLKSTLPHLATKVDIENHHGDAEILKPQLEHFVTKADLERICSTIEQLKLQLNGFAAKTDLEQLESDIRTISARLDAGFAHFATAADIAGVQAELASAQAGLRSEVEDTQSTIKRTGRHIMIGNFCAIVVAAGIGFVVVQFLAP